MKISDDPNLKPQPLTCATKTKQLNPHAELEFNKTRLNDIKEQIKVIKERIKTLKEILKKEVGDEIDVKDLLRQGSALGWQGRAQLIMSLRIKLIAMRSKFLDPPHKMYYRGPFDPKKEFELKFLPQKQDTLYHRMLAEKKKRILKCDKPITVLGKELEDLSIMHKAARFRTKTLIQRVKYARKELEKCEENAKTDLGVVEAMMAHQSLFKLMIEPETFNLDPSLKRHVVKDPLEPGKIEDWKKFKMSLEKSQKENNTYREVLLSLTKKIDEINKNLIESKRVEIENRLRFIDRSNFDLGKDKGKDKEQTDKENEFAVLIQENMHLRQFLTNSVLMAKEDFELFTNALYIAKREFIKSFQDDSSR